VRPGPAFSLKLAALRVGLVAHERSGRTAALTYWSFGQLASIASAPPSYLRTLPATIASNAWSGAAYHIQCRYLFPSRVFTAATVVGLPLMGTYGIHEPRS